MTEPRNSAEIKKLILAVADSISAKAVAMNGSRVYKKEVESDTLQDYDIIFVVSDDEMAKLIDNRDWLRPFGEVLIMQTPMDFSPKPINYEKRFNFLMLFADESRIDLGLVPESEVATWAKTDPVAEVLFDPKDILGGYPLVSTDRKYYRKKPTQGFFNRRTNEFWWISTYVVKGILRNQFFYAADHYFEGILGEYLMQVEWEVAQKHDFQINLGKNVGELFRYLTADEQAELQHFSDLSSLTKIGHNLLDIQKKYQEKAVKNAELNDLVYDVNEGLRVMEYTKRKLSGEI